MNKHLKLGEFEFEFVFRHKYEKFYEEFEELYNKTVRWKDYKLGLFFKRSKIVGRRNFNKTSEWKNNMVNEYMIGINLLICEAWFTVNKGGMRINEK